MSYLCCDERFSTSENLEGVNHLFNSVIVSVLCSHEIQEGFEWNMAHSVRVDMGHYSVQVGISLQNILLIRKIPGMQYQFSILYRIKTAVLVK